MANYIESDYGLNTENCILVLILVSGRKIYIFSGNNRFSVSDRKTMIDNAGKYLNSGQYYEAVKQLINDFDEYYSKDLTWVWAIVIVVGIILVGSIISGLIFCFSSNRDKIFFGKDNYAIDGGIGGGYGGGAVGGGVVGGSY